MENNKNLDTQLLLKELNKLINIVGDNCGPSLVKELEQRLDKVIDVFNRDLENLLKDSFNAHKNRLNLCKEMIVDNKSDDTNTNNSDKDSKSPLFIQKYEEKLGKKI